MVTRCEVPGLLPINEALQRIFESTSPILETEECDIGASLGRVIATDLDSPIDVPGFDNSAMDGYAVVAESTVPQQPLRLIGTSFAGTPFSGSLSHHECVRIMTGGVIPKGATAVVMQENTRVEDNNVIVLKAPVKGEAIRRAGSDIKKSSQVVSAGTRISPIHVGLLASLGIAKITVYKRLCIAVFSTGDELCESGEILKPGCIFDSNRAMLGAMITRADCDLIDLGKIPDDKSALMKAFEDAQQRADVIITTGGVSVGEADFTKLALQSLGQVGFWKIAMKPGKPLAFGKLRDAVFFGLPGNPVSAAATFAHIVMPALCHMSGEKGSESLSLQAEAAEAFRKRPGRTDFQRAICWNDDNGKLRVKSFKSQSSGVLSSFCKANCFAIIEQDRGNVAVGEQIEIQLFDKVIR